MDLKEYADAIALTGTFLFIIQMLTPLTTFYKIIRTRTTGDISVAPYNAAYLSCSLWMLYGIVLKDAYVSKTNGFAAVLQFMYTFVFYSYCTTKASVAKQVAVTSSVILVATAYCIFEKDHPTLLHRMGLTCSLFTLFFFVAPFANLRHVLRERNAESLPFLLILFTFVVSFMWMLYGVAIDDVALEATNLFGVIFSSIQLFLIAWFRPPPYPKGKPLLSGMV